MTDDIRKLEDKIDRVGDKVDDMITRASSIDINIAEHKATFAAHMVQDERAYDELVNIRRTQETSNSHLSEYNTQLKVHIAGVMELKEANVLMRKQIELSEQSLSLRLEVAELPIKWAMQTAKLMKWVASVGIAIGSIVGFLKYFKIF